jgi:hypothetical protein
MHKLYCYVDESGQDTAAHTSPSLVFVVAVVVLDEDRYELEQVCETYERASGKQKTKWGRAGHQQRLRYMRLVFADGRFQECLRFVVYGDVGRRFDEATVKAIARAVLWNKPQQPYFVSIYVDGLSKDKRRDYTSRLRGQGVSIYQVRGVAKDENSPLTRLADALAGFVRDAIGDEDDEAKQLFERAKHDGDVIEV